MGRKKRARAGRKWRRAPVPRAGVSPGTLIIDPTAPFPKLVVTAYGPNQLIEEEIGEPMGVGEYLNHYPVVWLNVDGLGDETTLHRLGEIFGLHRLALEDAVHTGQRPKVEEYADHLFIVVRAPTAGSHDTEQLTIILGTNWIVTFQEQEGDCFDGVRRRIREASGRIRAAGADYLAYALLDSVVDSYFPILDDLGEQLDKIEDEIFGRTDSETTAVLHDLKRQLLQYRRRILPLREAIAALQLQEEPFVKPTTQVFLRDCHDHAIRLVELVETLRESASDLMATHLTVVSNRMNEVMKVLTIIATIFIPLSFIAGLYGMNFDPAASRWNMPELGWRFGYPIALGLMGAVALGLLLFMRRKGWFR